MAFSIVGPRHFLGSGHPDLREGLPPQLGLIESTDAGETWQPLALQGEADFHLLEQVGPTLYAYEATSGTLLATQDRTAFDEVATLALHGLAGDPNDPGRLLATTDQGQLVEIDPATGTTDELAGPALVLLDTTANGGLVGIDPAGTVHVSDDGGQNWRRRGEIGGQPAALSTTGEAWYAATTDQVFKSSDTGASWTRVL